MKMKLLLTTLVIASVVITTGCRDDSFNETKGLCPTVVSTNPSNLATNVPLNQVITVTFNEEMDPSTINNSTFILYGSIVEGTVTYANKVATFTPTYPLIENHTYTGQITTGMKDLNGNAIQDNYVWTFSTGATLRPMVIATNPFDMETGVVINKIVTATFNLDMDAASITDSTFTLKTGSTLISGTVSYSDSTASFNPSADLLPNTVYIATIKSTVKNTTGNDMLADYVWTFTTGTLVAPKVTLTDPLNNATGIALNKVITATFDMPMDAATLQSPATSFVVKRGTIVVAGAVTYAGNMASFTPTANLIGGTQYTVTISTGAKNLAGTGLANNYVWKFTTIALVPPTVTATNPLNNASNVPLNKILTANFSVPMDASTISGTTFTLKHGATSVAGNVSYSGSTATFTPGANLLSATTYTATITTGAKNLAGTPLASNYVWTFTTPAALGPLAPNLNSVARFGIISGVGVSNNAGFSVINNLDVGIYPGARSSITGFPPATIVNGAMYAADDLAPAGVPAMLLQAKTDLTNAYLFAEGAVSPAPATVSGDIGGTTLAPGIYKSTSTLLIQSGDLTLDAQGDVNAVWIFQIASDFTTVGGAGGSVILSGGAQAKNVYWQTGSSATIGDFTSFKGNVLALTSITMNSGAVAEGRMLARNGSVVMTSGNTITKP